MAIVDQHPTPSARTYLGLFSVALATVMYEIILTRIFSVTMWYHFAFVAISVAMFGMTVGALVVYLQPGLFTVERVHAQLALASLGFGVSIVPSLLLHLHNPAPLGFSLSLVGVLATVWEYAVIALPFVFSGIAVCLALTRFPAHVGRLYAVDLAGAALACLLVVVALDVTDGPTAAIAVSSVAALAGTCFARAGASALGRTALVVTLALGALAAVHTALVWWQWPIIRPLRVKGFPEPRPLYERWNSFSRVTVYGNPETASKPRGWGMSSVTPEGYRARQLMLAIDGGAGTVLTGFDGRLEGLEYLRFDVTNLPYWIRRGANVLVIGPGGGRDILSALLFGQRKVVAVEINGAIIDTVTRRFGDFTGRLDRDPRVTFVNDEARSWVARQHERFDIIQVSLIDTWAATAAGAFVLTENSLYTVEAWRTFLDRLAPGGLFSVSRFYFRDRPDEIYRLTSLARAALRSRGVADPRPHVVIVRQLGRAGARPAPVGMATLLLGRAPFTGPELDTLEEVARRMRFDVVLSPRVTLDDAFATLASPADPGPWLARFPANVAAPTDDTPFFFHTLRLRDAFALARGGDLVDNINLQAVSVLGALLVAVVGLTLLCIVVPLGLSADRAVLRGSGLLFVFFAAIGLGFMLVEISQMQRLIIFLGHPTYGLSVVLFALLASSGVGSSLSGALARRGRLARALPLGALLVALAAFGGLTPAAIRAFSEGTTPLRIVVSVAILCPLGVLMGTAFPLGMSFAGSRAPALGPWLWGINGATSVCASVLAVVIALGAGISTAFWSGFACYAVAAAALARLAALERPRGAP